MIFPGLSKSVLQPERAAYSGRVTLERYMLPDEGDKVNVRWGGPGMPMHHPADTQARRAEWVRRSHVAAAVLHEAEHAVGQTGFTLSSIPEEVSAMSPCLRGAEQYYTGRVIVESWTDGHIRIGTVLHERAGTGNRSQFAADTVGMAIASLSNIATTMSRKSPLQ